MRCDNTTFSSLSGAIFSIKYVIKIFYPGNNDGSNFSLPVIQYYSDKRVSDSTSDRSPILRIN